MGWKRREAHCLRRNLLSLVYLVVLLTGLVLGGCVSKGEYEAVVSQREAALEQLAQIKAEKVALAAERDALDRERSELMKEKFALNKQIEMTEAEKEQARLEAEKAKAEIERQQDVYASLQKTFAKEQEQNQVQVELLKSGIKVNLANDILFPSGSAMLNENGIEVLKRAAVELMKSPYQTLVAGFTDNVPISSSRYPSNWELAGARAASVVRLLEAEGVPSDQMLAISFGENSPVASNETPEGRSENRRIEMLLRPVPIEMR